MISVLVIRSAQSGFLGQPIISASEPVLPAEWSLADRVLGGQNLQTMAEFLSPIINQCYPYLF